MAERLLTTAKKIVKHYELDDNNDPKLYTTFDCFDIVIGEFGGKQEFKNLDSVTPHAEYSFSNGLKVWAGFHLNEFKQYQLNHIVLGS